MVKNLDKNQLLNHIENDKKIILRKVIDKLEMVIKNHSCISTDFLDPYEIKLSKSILNRFDEINYSIDGGYEKSERSIIYIFPSYIHGVNGDDITKLSFKNNGEFTHKNILGTLMSLGIERKKIGDIVTDSKYWHIFLKSELADYVKYNLDKINNNSIKFENNIVFSIPKINYITDKFIVSSLRLDVFLSTILKISRSESSKLIESGYVKVNYKVEFKISVNLAPNDLISVRRYGRIIFDRIEKITKKDKYLIIIKIPK